MWRILCAVVVTALPLAAGEEAWSCRCRVQTDAGPVRGHVRRADHGAGYLSFRGVPYASQPVGALRFKPLERAEPWTETLDARDEGPVCPQHTLFYEELMAPQGMDEACIHVNVHVPLSQLCRPLSGRTDATTADKDGGCAAEAEEAEAAEVAEEAPQPVLVFVHGGGFGFGSGDADFNGPEYLVGKGVLVVTFNYRIGVLGFLSLNTAELPGNLGLRDAVEALRWVRRNIAAFGGDPDNVTLAGQSAGAAAAHLLTMAPMAAGLFHRVIIMSGAATRSWFSTSPSNAARVAATLLLKLNVTGGDAYSALRAVPVARLVAATRDMQDAEGVTVFVPVVESRFDGVEPLLVDDPDTLLSEGRYLDVPLLIGHTSAECETFAARFRDVRIAEKAAENPLVLVPPSLLFAAPPERLERAAAAIVRRYFRDGAGSLDEFVEYCTDAYYVYPALRLAELAARRRRAPVYMYEFSYGGRDSAVRRALGAGRQYAGAAHAEDLGYVLRVNSYAGAAELDDDDSPDCCVREWMTTLFSNFIKTGEPTPTFEGEHALHWPAYTAGAALTLAVNETLTVRRHRRLRLLDFFDELHDPAAPSLRSNITQPSIYLLPPKTD